MRGSSAARAVLSVAAISLVLNVGIASALAAPSPNAGIASVGPATVGLAPDKPELSLSKGDLVRKNTALKGTGATRAETMTVQTHKHGHGWVDRWVGPVAIGPDGAFELPDAGLPFGPFAVRVVASNGAGESTSDAVYIYNLGAVPAHSRLVLVDKSSRRFYVIVAGRVRVRHGCAIGMPWAPTPTGTFKLGNRHRTPNPVWGPWRLRLWRIRTTTAGTKVLRRTSFYIHGTNDPSSIGHMRSHGCVRLLNKNIRRLSTVIDGYVAVIRK